MTDGDRARWRRFFAAPRIRLGVQSLLLALLMAGITVSGVKVFGFRWRPTALQAPPLTSAKPNTLPSPGIPKRLDLSHDQVLVPVPDESESSEAPQKKPPSATEDRHLSATEMFALAKLARAQGNALEAIRISKQIEEFFPSSEEGINTHLTLGLLYLEQAQPELALQEFATFRRIGSPEMKAEAYFGQAQALGKLSRTEDERVVLEELLQSYPRSAYVSAARIRLNELGSDAGGR